MQFNPLIPELTVLDMEKSLAFYTELLPFVVEYQRPEERFALLSLGEAQLMIEERNGCWESGTLEYPFGRGVNFQIRVADAAALQARCKAAGYPLRMELQDNWYRAGEWQIGQREFLLLDPDGYMLRFAQPLGERNAKTVEER